VTHPHLDFTYDGQKIVTLPLADNIQRAELGFARHAQIRPTRAMKVFLDFCTDWFSKYYPHGGYCRAEPPLYDQSAGSLSEARKVSNPP